MIGKSKKTSRRLRDQNDERKSVSRSREEVRVFGRKTGLKAT